MFNILLSSAGRQTFLVEAFQEALNGRGKVFAADFDPTAKALACADGAFVALAYSDAGYFNWITNICQKEKIGLLVSLNVDELLILEPLRENLAKFGCTLVGGPLGSIQITYDKLALNHFCKKTGLPVIKTWQENNILESKDVSFPLIAKKRFGKGSRGQMKIWNQKELLDFFVKQENLPKDEEYIFQEWLEGVEYGFDLVNNFDGHFEGILVRRKYAMKNGETDIALTENSDNWLSFGELISNNLKHQGTIDMDAIVVNGKPHLIDVNFRFGGGYAFSHLAGANIPKTYVSWALRESIDPDWLKPQKGIFGQRTSIGVIKKTKL